MTNRLLLVLPFVLATALALAVSLAGPGSASVAYRLGVESSKALALAGCAVAALSFERADYLRRAWGLNGACLALLLARDATLMPAFARLGVTGLVWVQGVLVIAANASSVLGTWWMARAGDVAGIELPGSAVTRRAALGAAALLALAITGLPMAHDAAALAGGDVRAIVPLASDIGDIAGLCLIAPVLLTTFAMRGGRLAWPFGLFAASLLSWLLYDAGQAIRSFVEVDTAQARLVTEMLRTLACGFLFSAGLAQRAAVR